MPLLAEEQASGNGIELHGAPDVDIGKPEEEQHLSRTMQIDLKQETIEEIKKCIETSKLIQLSFGKAPTLRIGDRTRPLRISPSIKTFRCELYKTAEQEKASLEFAGLVSHRMAISEAQDQAKRAESSLATLQASLAQWKKDKEDNSATFITNQATASTLNSIKAKHNVKNNPKSTAANSERKQSTFFKEFARSHPSSPSLNPSQPKPKTYRPPPTSAPSNPAQLTGPLTHGPRFALFHCLALGPTSELEIIQRTRIPKSALASLLDKFANKIENKDLWELTDRTFKDLNVWVFPYQSDSERQTAISNAIRAYDRLRLSREDNLWQLLLPKAERGKGIVLSKLKLGGTPANNRPTNGVPAQAKDNATLHSDNERSRSRVGGASAVRASSNEPKTTEMARKRTVANKKPNDAKETPKSSATAKDAGAKKTKKVNVERHTDFGNVDEGSSDLEEVFSGLSSDAEKKASLKANNNISKPKKTSASLKRKADGKIKSDEFVLDSSDLLEEEDEVDEKPLAERAKLKSADSNPPRQLKDKRVPKEAVPPATKVGRANSLPKDKNSLKKPSHIDKSKKSEPKGTPKQQNSPLKSEKPLKPLPKPASSSKSNPNATVVLHNGNKTTATSTSSTFFKEHAPKANSGHKHSSSQSSGNSNASAGQNNSLNKRPTENHSSPEVVSKKRKSDSTVEKAPTVSSSSPLTNASDLPNFSSPERSSPLPSKTVNNKAGQSTATTRNGPISGSKPAQGVQKSTPNGTTNGTSEVAKTSHGKNSPTDEMIAGLKAEYSKMFTEHIIRHFDLDQRSDDTVPDKAEYNAKFEEVQKLHSTIETLLRRSGRDETFPAIPDDFSSASVPGLLDHVRGKLSGLSQRYDFQRNAEKLANGEFSEESKKQLLEIYDEIKELQALLRH